MGQQWESNKITMGNNEITMGQQLYNNEATMGQQWDSHKITMGQH